MTAHQIIAANGCSIAPGVFPAETHARFSQNYPETPHLLDHNLDTHALLTTEALADLGEALPPASVEYNKGAIPVGIDADKVPANGLSIGETIRHIETSASWAVLKNVEQVPAYRALLLELLAEIRAEIEAGTGELLRPQAYIFVSSPASVTPFHFDPEHNILLQLRGEKHMTVFPPGDDRFAPPSAHEAYHAGGGRNLGWLDSFADQGATHHLTPGRAIYVPVMSPHFVKNGDAVSISLSITWRSEWSFAEADAHGMNRVLRKWGVTPQPTKRFPDSNAAKAYAYRVLRRLRLTG